jgi:hypothetical protein
VVGVCPWYSCMALSFGKAQFAGFAARRFSST